MDGVAKTITFDITTREMRRLVADLHGKSWVDQMHQVEKQQTVDQLRVVITDLTCADTVVMGIVCRADYHLGTDDHAGPSQQGWFRMRRAGQSESWFDALGPKKTLFNLSPRHCTRD
jgi:hypothetical protein